MRSEYVNHGEHDIEVVCRIDGQIDQYDNVTPEALLRAVYWKTDSEYVRLEFKSGNMYRVNQRDVLHALSGTQWRYAHLFTLMDKCRSAKWWFRHIVPNRRLDALEWLEARLQGAFTSLISSQLDK